MSMEVEFNWLTLMMTGQIALLCALHYLQSTCWLNMIKVYFMSSDHDAKTNGIQMEVPEPTPSAVSSLKWIRPVIDSGIIADIYFGF